MSSSQGSFGRGDAGASGEAARIAERLRHALELRLTDVVGRPPVAQVDVDRDVGGSARTPARSLRPARCRTPRSSRPASARRAPRSCGRTDRAHTSTAASSSGTTIEANRRTPALSPSASANAWPIAMPTSSTVWWPSTCRSPLHVTSRSQPACLPSCCTMWSKNGMPGVGGRVRRAVQVQFDPDVGLLRGTRDAGGAAHALQDLLEAGEEQVDLVLGAGGDAQGVGHHGREVANQNAAIQQPLPHLRRVAGRDEQHEVGVATGTP